jgi:hypothetical protein
MIQNTVVCDQEEMPALSVKAASIMPILTGVKQAKRRREMVPVLLIRLHNKSSGNYSPTQQVSVDPAAKTSMACAYSNTVQL